MTQTVDFYLEALGLTCEDVAEQAGVPAHRVEAIAAGRWTPSPSDRVSIAKVFGVSVTDISWGHTLDPRNVRYRRFGLREDIG